MENFYPNIRIVDILYRGGICGRISLVVTEWDPMKLNTSRGRKLRAEILDARCQ